ncbi:MAG: hypothetical protein R3Y56_07040 [Akkermansia sp.]
MKLIVGLCISILSLAILGIGLYYGMRSYLQHDSFRSKLQDWVQNFAQAEKANITHNLELGDEDISLKNIELSRQDSLQSFAINGLELTYRQRELYKQKLHFTHAKIKQLDVQLDLDRSGEQLPSIETPQGNILDALLPREYSLDQVRCKNANATIQRQGKTYRLADFALAAEPTEPKSMSAWKIALRRGTISTPFDLIKQCPVESANISIGPEGYTLDDCRILLSPGDIQIKAAYDKAAQGWSADIKSNKANVKHLLSESWKAKISGDLFCKAILRGDNSGITIANGRLYLQKGVVEALPFLSNLKLRNSYPYRHLDIHQASCQLIYPYNEPSLNIRDAWLFDDINIVSNGKIQIKGHVIIGRDESLSGSLLVGLPQYVVAALASGSPELVEQLFNAGSDGDTAWVRINLSGTLDNPQQDLSIRLEQMAGAFAMNAAGSAATSVLGLLGVGDKPEQDNKDKPAKDDESQAPDAPQTKPSLFQQGADSAKGLLESIF